MAVYDVCGHQPNCSCPAGTSGHCNTYTTGKSSGIETRKYEHHDNCSSYESPKSDSVTISYKTGDIIEASDWNEISSGSASVGDIIKDAPLTIAYNNAMSNYGPGKRESGTGQLTVKIGSWSGTIRSLVSQDSHGPGTIIHAHTVASVYVAVLLSSLDCYCNSDTQTCCYCDVVCDCNY